MTCATLERLVQALSTSHCSISNFETGHILTERCDEIAIPAAGEHRPSVPRRSKGWQYARASGAGALECSCPPAMACGHRLLLYFPLKGTRTRRLEVRRGPWTPSPAESGAPSPAVAGRPLRVS